jgi:hypothetical protein
LFVEPLPILAEELPIAGSAFFDSEDCGVPDAKLLGGVSLSHAVSYAAQGEVVGLEQWLRVEQCVVKLAGDVTLEAAQNVAFALALEGALGDVFFRALVGRHAHQGDVVDRRVCRAVAAAGKAMPCCPA